MLVPKAPAAAGYDVEIKTKDVLLCLGSTGENFKLLLAVLICW